MSALDVVNSEAAKIAGDLKIDDRVDEYIQASSFITIKDHKPNFPGKIECRLLNPAKSNLGKISKMVLDDVITDVKRATSSNQSINSGEVITWFRNLEDKMPWWNIVQGRKKMSKQTGQ